MFAGMNKTDRLIYSFRKLEAMGATPALIKSVAMANGVKDPGALLNAHRRLFSRGRTQSRQ